MYLHDSNRMDKSLSSLHPYRKLRSFAQSLSEERRAACQRLLSMFRFRQITVDGGSQLVPELAESMDGKSSSTSALYCMIVCLIVTISRVLDTWLPFPLVVGTLATSPCLHTPSSVYETGGLGIYPRILHTYKRVILPITGDQTLSSHALLVEDTRYLAWTIDPGILTVSQDILQTINQILISQNLGREIANPLQRSFPSSPSLSSSYSPSYRRSVIEQSVTEGGEWTLLDQL
jgi:hypothetical protein